jgi:flagellar hook assembly protein FlgD
LVTFDIRLQEPAKVQLTVYNSMGQIVATILDEPLEKGTHLVTWSAGNLSPGIYFYRLSTVNGQLSTSGKLFVVR